MNKEISSQTAAMLADLSSLICAPTTSDEQKAESIALVYRIGKIDGYAEGSMKTLRECAVSMDAALDRMVKAVAP